MILPDKNIKLEYSLLNCGAQILKILDEPKTLSEIWSNVKHFRGFTGYEKFLLVLDYLFMINAIALSDDLIMRCNDDKRRTK